MALAVLITPAFADTFLVYSEGGIPLSTDISTWCFEGQPCAEKPLKATCDTPEGSESWWVRTVSWAGFGVIRKTCGGTDVFCWTANDPLKGCNNPLIGDGTCNEEGFDLSAYENGEIRFFVKSAYNLSVGMKCAGTNRERPLAEFGWTAPAAGQPPTWQEVAIPVCELFPNRTCGEAERACLEDVSFPFLATVGGLTSFGEYFVDYVRWVTESSHAGPSSVEVQGRQLLVNGEPFVVNAVAYSPVAPCQGQIPWRDHPDRYPVDFPLIAASGANAIRVYTPVLTTAMLDAAWAAGLHVIPTFQVDPLQLTCEAGRGFMHDRVREMVLKWKDHPAILMWLIGNEVNVHLPTDPAVSLCDDWYPQLDALAQTIHEAEGDSFHPVGTANADSISLSDICLPGCSDDASLPNHDFWAVHLYRGCSFGGAFSQYASKTDCARPLIIGEFGADAWDSLMGAENETMQADCLESLLGEAEQALAVRAPDGVSSGQVLFEWSDEWWKAFPAEGGDCITTDWCSHDTCKNWTNPAYSDPAMNEEWWGIVSVDGAEGNPEARGLREATDRVAASWLLGDVCDHEVAAHDAGSDEVSLAFAPAPGAADHALYYGPLSAVSSYGYTGSVSGLGATGSSAVTLPSGSLFWVIAARNGVEGCYGTDSAGAERPCFPSAGSCAVTPAAHRSCECSAP